MTRRDADPPSPFRPFADEVSVQTFAGFSVENGTDRIALHGSLDLTRDREGLARARALQTILTAAIAVLETEDLPETLSEETEPAKPVRNPFA